MKFKDAFDAARWMFENKDSELLADLKDFKTTKYKWANGNICVYGPNGWFAADTWSYISWTNAKNWRTPDEDREGVEKISETVFQDELTKLINRFGLDSRTGIADYLLAQYVHNNLRDLNYIIGEKK